MKVREDKLARIKAEGESGGTTTTTTKKSEVMDSPITEEDIPF